MRYLIAIGILLMAASAYGSHPKRAVVLEEPETRGTWLDGAPFEVGLNLYDRLQTELSTADSPVVLVQANPGFNTQSFAQVREADPIINNAPPIVGGKISMHVIEISLVTGSRGTRRYWGFKPGYENGWNTGGDTLPDDDLADPKTGTHFAGEFSEKPAMNGGLLAGSEIPLEFLLAGLIVRHETWRARLVVELSYRDVQGAQVLRQVTTTATGIFLDVVGHVNYDGVDYSGGLAIGTRGAMKHALSKMVSAIVGDVKSQVVRFPLLTKVLQQADDGGWYLSIGDNFGVRRGDKFYVSPQGQPGTGSVELKVDASYTTVAHVKSAGQVSPGDLAILLGSGGMDPGPTKFAEMASAPAPAPQDENNVLLDFLRTLTFGPRLIQWLRTDREWKDPGKREAPKFDDLTAAAEKSWAAKSMDLVNAWKKYGTGDANIRVAVIDSGVDYRHSDLSPAVTAIGTDWVSGDARPFDEHGHGTEIASLIAGKGTNVVAAAPTVSILPIKVFTPYGKTGASPMIAAFDEAIQKNAAVIVCAWSADVPAQAVKEGIRRAADAGIPVIVSSGDVPGDALVYPAAWGAELANLIVVGGLAADGSHVGRTSGAQIFAPADKLTVARAAGGTVTRSHTGLAAAEVAGIVALGKTVCNATPQRIRELLQSLDNRAINALSYLDLLSRDCK